MSQDLLKAGVVGWPVAQSLSPALHRFWLARYGIDGSYDAFAVAPGEFDAFISTLARQGMRGVNITLPHKERAVQLMDELDLQAARTGAVNTIVVGADGRLRGLNTDGFGFRENIKDVAPEFSPATGPAVILGGGGGARAIALSLIEQGCAEIRLLNRTQARAERLARNLGRSIRVWPWRERNRALRDAVLLVNTTSLGMSGEPQMDLELTALPRRAIVNDIVYRPLETKLLHEAKARGNVCVDGLGMLLHQARPGFAAWFGRDPEVTPELRSFMLTQYG
jgi:shikimate dehydrogenase